MLTGPHWEVSNKTFIDVQLLLYFPISSTKAYFRPVSDSTL